MKTNIYKNKTYIASIYFFSWHSPLELFSKEEH